MRSVLGLFRSFRAPLLVVAVVVASALALPTAASASPAVALPAAAPPAEPAGQPATVSADSLPTVQVNGVVWAQVVVGDTVYVGGNFTKARPAGSAPGQNEVTRTHLLAYDITTGQLRNDFAPVLNAEVKALAVSPDGSRLYVGGAFVSIDGVGRYRIAAFDTATNTVIHAFAAQVDYHVNALVATADAVYAGGAFSNVRGNARARLAAFAPVSGALLAWAPQANNTVHALTMAPTGDRVIVGGQFSSISGQTARGTASLDATTGSLLPWALNQTIYNNGTNASITSLDTDGTWIYGSAFHYGGDSKFEGTFKADPLTGAVQWIEDCHGDTYGVYAVTGIVYTVGHAHYCANVGGKPEKPTWDYHYALAFSEEATRTIAHDPMGYMNLKGKPAPSILPWYPELTMGTFTGQSQAAWTISGDERYVLVGGEFPRVNGVGQQGLARFAVRDLAPKQQKPMLSGGQFMPTLTSEVAGEVRVAFRANWDRDDRTLTYTVARNGDLNNPVWTGTADSMEWDRPMLGFVDSGLTPGSTHAYRVSASDADGNRVWSDTVSITVSGTPATTVPYTELVKSHGASLLWSFEEASGTGLRDSIGFSDPGTTGSVGRVTSGAVGKSLSLGGGTVYSSGAVTAPDVFTVQAWFRTSSTQGGRIVGLSNLQTGTSNHRDRQLYMNNAGRLSFGIYGASATSITSSASYNDNAWHQVTGVQGPDGMSLYVDGVLVARGGPVEPESYIGYWRAGADTMSGWANTGSSAGLNATIDEIAVYPTALDFQQINAQYIESGRSSLIPLAPADAYGAAVYADQPVLYWRLNDTSGSTAADSGPGRRPGTYRGTVTKNVVGAVTGTTDRAVTFNGSSGFVSSNTSQAGPQTYTVEAWFKTTTTRGGKIIGFGNSGTSTSSTADRHVYMRNDGKLVFGAGSTFNDLLTGTSYNDGEWHQVVATHGGGTMTLYVDGLPVATRNGVTASSYTGFWRVGADRTGNSTSNFLAGTIDEAAVHDKVLTADQVRARFVLGGGVPANLLPTAQFDSQVRKLAVTVDGSASTDPDGTLVSYQWTFGDGATGSGVTAEHTYAGPGTYPVTLTVTDDRTGQASVTRSVVTVANLLPTAAISVEHEFLTAALDGSGSTDPDGTVEQYAWDLGDGTTAVGPTVDHTWSAVGTYTVTLTVTDDDGATQSATRQITAVLPPNQLPTADFSALADQLTVDLDASASADPDGQIVQWDWDLGDGTTVDGSIAQHVYAAPGTYQVTLTVTDDRGGSAQITRPVVASLNASPVASISATTYDLELSVDGSASTDAEGPLAGYLWDFGDGQTSTDAVTTHTYAAFGTYTVALTVTDGHGATTTVSQPVTVTSATIAADDFARTVASGWGTAVTGGAWTVSSGGASSVASGGGSLTSDKGWTRTSRLNSVSAADVELTTTFTLDKVPTGGFTQLSAVARRTATAEYRVTLLMSTTGTVSVQLNRVVGGAVTTLASRAVPGATFGPGTEVHVAWLVKGSGSVDLAASVWTGPTRPTTWTVTAVDAAPTPELAGPGAVGVQTYVSGLATEPITIGVRGLTVMVPRA